jgi:protein tyrosine phosphatase (PTP) superfamily phosphohydrolase (DUF442 family)
MGMHSPLPIGRVHVGEEPDDDDIAALAAGGFRSIVCLSRGGVGREGSPADHERAAAEASGLAFLRLTAAAGVTAETVRAFREVMRVLPRPIYLHCGFGDRAATLALAAESDLLADPAATIDALAERGIHLPPRLIAELAELRVQAACEGNLPERFSAPGGGRKFPALELAF